MAYGRSTWAAAAFTQTAHWGELIQGPIPHRGRLITGLITLPRSDRGSTAVFTPSPGELTVEPNWRLKAEQAARLVLQKVGSPDLGGTLSIQTNIPSGCGGGSTTADVTATIWAVSKAAGLRLTPNQVQRLDWLIEKAADPLALLAVGRAVVYGSRTGETIRWLNRPLPAMRCLGFNAEPGRTILTEELASRTEYRPAEQSAFQGVLDRATKAIESNDLTSLAQAATDSARLNQSRLPTRHFEEILKAIRVAGGAGLAVSHSGTVGAAIFHPGQADVELRIREVADALRALGCADIGPFGVCGGPFVKRTTTGVKHLATSPLTNIALTASTGCRAAPRPSVRTART